MRHSKELKQAVDYLTMLLGEEHATFLISKMVVQMDDLAKGTKEGFEVRSLKLTINNFFEQELIPQEETK